MNIMLMESYDEYEKNKTINKLEEFTKLTFPTDGTDKLFIGCVLILFENIYKTRLSAETLYTIVESAKIKIKSSNYLKFYVERINDNKMVSKYLKNVINDTNFIKYVDLILEYIIERSFDFKAMIDMRYSNKILEYQEKID